MLETIDNKDDMELWLRRRELDNLPDGNCAIGNTKGTYTIHAKFEVEAFDEQEASDKFRWAFWGNKHKDIRCYESYPKQGGNDSIALGAGASPFGTHVYPVAIDTATLVSPPGAIAIGVGTFNHTGHQHAFTTSSTSLAIGGEVSPNAVLTVQMGQPIWTETADTAVVSFGDSSDTVEVVFADSS